MDLGSSSGAKYGPELGSSSVGYWHAAIDDLVGEANGVRSSLLELERRDKMARAAVEE